MSALAERVPGLRADLARRMGHLARWEVSALDRAETVVELGDGVLDAVRSGSETVICLRVERGGRVGTATSTDLDDLDSLVADAVAACAFGPAATLPAPGDRPAPEPVAHTADQTQSNVNAGLRELADGLVRARDRSGLAVHATVTNFRQVTLRLDPAAALFRADQYWHTAAVAEGRHDQGLQATWDAWTATPQLPVGLEGWLRRLAAWEQLPSVPVTAPKEMILAPAAVHALLTPLTGALSGPAVAAGRSFLADRFGEKVFHPVVDVVDGPASAEACTGLLWPSVDDQGVPCRPLRLVESGVPVTAFHTRESAAAAAIAPTGHGFRGNALRRSMLRPVSAVLNGLSIDVPAGRTGALDDLIADTTDGILIESLLGTQQRAGLTPIVQGRIRLGFVIRHGQVVGRLFAVPVAIDLLDVLGREFADVSEEQWPVSRIWSGALPFVRARSMAP